MYRVQFAYPVTSIKPTEYDDWESFFIGNHIYRRLLPDEDRKIIPSVASNLKVMCIDDKLYPSDCKRMKISFRVVPFKDCNNRLYGYQEVKNEFISLLKEKSWVLSNWHECVSGKDMICIVSNYTADILRKLQNINFRFGWSMENDNDEKYGSGPYCLANIKKREKGTILSGFLRPMDRNSNLPTISFHVSPSKDDIFDMAIYGSNDLLDRNRSNLQTHTPLIYYVVTTPRLSKYILPWNSMKSRLIISAFLIKNGVIFPDIPQSMRLAPYGNALSYKGKYIYDKKQPVKFMVPNYLPNCQSLANELNSSWGDNIAKAECVDIVSLVVKKVRAGQNYWDGFLVGAVFVNKVVA